MIDVMEKDISYMILELYNFRALRILVDGLSSQKITLETLGSERTTLPLSFNYKSLLSGVEGCEGGGGGE